MNLHAYHEVLWVVLDAWTSVTCTLEIVCNILAVPEIRNYNKPHTSYTQITSPRTLVILTILGCWPPRICMLPQYIRAARFY